MTRYALLTSMIGCSGLLAYVLASHGHPVYAVDFVLLGAAWIFLHLRGMTRFIWLIFFTFALLAVFVIWLGVSHWTAMAGMIFALLAWDLSAFEAKLQGIPIEDIRQMETAHFTRLALVIGLGVIGVFISTLIKVSLTLGSALIAALFGIWGISSLVYHLRSRE